LQKAAPTLKGKAIIDSHNQETVKAIMGTVEEVWYDEAERAVKFIGDIKDKKIQEMIDDGRITKVSIGARAKELVKGKKNGEMFFTAKGIEFLELSLVAVEGVEGARLSQLSASYDYALQEAFRKKEEIMDEKQIVVLNEEKLSKMEEKMSELEKKLATGKVTEELSDEDAVQVKKDLEAVLTRMKTAYPEKPEEKPEKTPEKKPEEEGEKPAEAYKKELKALKSQLTAIEDSRKAEIVEKVFEAKKATGIKLESEEAEKKTLSHLGEEALTALEKNFASMKKEKVKPKGQLEAEKIEAFEDIGAGDIVIERKRGGLEIWQMPKESTFIARKDLYGVR